MIKMETRIHVIGARPVKSRQAGAAPGSKPQQSPPPATGGPSVPPCGARGRRSKATGHSKKKSPITIMHWNAEGINTKKMDLEHLLRQKEISVCCLQETHLSEGKPFKIRGYQCFRADRRDRRKGGVLTLVRNNINACENKRHLEGGEYVEVELKTETTSLRVVNYYCPNDKPHSLNTIDVPESNFIIVGDFNSHSQSWGYDHLDKRGEDVEEWQDDNHLTLVNKPGDPPTFFSRRWHSTTTPDLALCTDDVHRRREVSDCERTGGSIPSPHELDP